MDRETEIALLDEVLGLLKQKSAYLDETVSHSPVSRYLDPERFARERERLFLQSPNALAHSSELPEEGSFLRRELAGAPALLTRDRNGEVHAFYNICRHRGAALVPEAVSGCRHRFTCPYHAWTWDNQGRLIAAPHREQGFPDLDEAAYGLKRMAVAERFGWIWVQPGAQDAEAMAIDAHLAPLAADFDWLGLADLEVHAVEERVWNANWKVLVEGGLEAYHFRVAHAATIAALFHDNLSTYQMKGRHIRSVLARRSVDDLVERPRAEWRIREHANLLYTVFPSLALLAQADHVAAIQNLPLSVDRTLVRVMTLRPRADGPLDEKTEKYWSRNQALTARTLAEDFELGERIQSGFATGVNESVTFGRFEGALDRFNGMVEQELA